MKLAEFLQWLAENNDGWLVIGYDPEDDVYTGYICELDGNNMSRIEGTIMHHEDGKNASRVLELLARDVEKE